MPSDIQKWRRATFLHLDKKNEALEKLHDAELRIQQLESLYEDSVYSVYVLILCILVVCVVNLYDNFKNYM
jgi:hypothetical protein